MEKILSKKIVYQGRVIKVEEKEIDFGNGNKGVWESAIVEPREGVVVLGVDEKQNVYLVRQWKGGTEMKMIHPACGGVPKGVDPAQQAAAEFQEETGYRAGKLTKLLVSYSDPGYTFAKGHFFLAEDLVHDPIEADESEDTELIIMPFEEALEKALSGEIEDQRTVLIMLFVDRMQRLKKS